VTTEVVAAGSNNFLLPNFTIVIEFVIFLAVLFVFYRFIVPPLTKAMRERDEMVKQQAENRDNAYRRLREAEERYDKALSEARAEASAIRDEARADAQRIRDDMRAETDRQVAEIHRRGEEQLQAQRAQAVESLRSELGGLSTQLAGRILDTPMGEHGPQGETVQRFLAGLERTPSSGGKN
jgi:F-type H+-transporting ATPase subunit b